MLLKDSSEAVGWSESLIWEIQCCCLGYVDFQTDTYIPSQLIMISHDRLAQYWEVSVLSERHLV